MTSGMLALCWMSNGRPETVEVHPGLPVTQTGLSLWMLVAMGTSLGGGMLLESRVREPAANRRKTIRAVRLVRKSKPEHAPAGTAARTKAVPSVRAPRPRYQRGEHREPASPGPLVERAGPRAPVTSAPAAPEPAGPVDPAALIEPASAAEAVDPPGLAVRMRTPSEAWQTMHTELLEVITALRSAAPGPVTRAPGRTDLADPATRTAQEPGPSGPATPSPPRPDPVARGTPRPAVRGERTEDPGANGRLPGARCAACGSAEIDVLSVGASWRWSARFECRDCRRVWPRP